MIISSTPDSYVVTNELDFQVVLTNHDFSKKISLTGDAVLTPKIYQKLAGPRGGTAELVHSGYSFGPYAQDDEDKLIGAWVQIEVEGTVEFVGRIEKVTRRMGADQDQIVYEARDIWSALADKQLTLAFDDGISPGGVLGVIQGDSYTVTRIIGGNISTRTITSGPLVPVDRSGEPLITFSDELISGGKSTLVRQFDAEPVNDVISKMALEMGFEVVDFEPSPIGSGTLGKIVGRSVGAEERSLVFGAPSATDWDDLAEIPFAISISGTVDYSSVVTQVLGIGGDITEAIFARLYPAWNQTLDAAYKADPKLARDQEGLYGMVGRIFYVGQADVFSGIVPFTEVPTQKAMEAAFEEGSANVQDHVQIYEHNLAKNIDYTDTDAWGENNSAWILVQHNTSMWFKNQINYHGLRDATWARNNYALVLFAEPQVVLRTTPLNGGSGPRQESLLLKNNMYMEAMRTRGRVSYLAAHRGKFPFVRERAIYDERYRKHLQRYRNDSPFARGHLRKTATGVEETPGSHGPATSLSWWDTTPQLANLVEGIANESSVPDNSTEIHISGLDKSWKVGQRLKELIDSDGDVFKGELDWDVRSVSFSNEERLTRLFFDNKLRIGAF